MKRILLAFCLVAFVGCSSATSSTKNPSPGAGLAEGDVPQDKQVLDIEGVHGGTLKLALESNLETFNPITSTTVSVDKVFKNTIYQNLVDIDLKTLKVKPVLARSIEYLDGGKTMRLKLRRGVKWSDGKPFTMEDVKFTYKVVMDPKITNNLKYIMKQPDGTYPTINYVDDETVDFSINEVNALFPASVGIVYMLPKHKWGKAYEEGRFMQSMLLNTDPKDIVGTGPFTLTSYVADQAAILKRNPSYWKFDKNGKRLPYLNKIVRLIVPDKAATLVKFRNGEVDMYAPLPEQYDLLKREEKSGKFTITNLGTTLSTTYVMVNQNQAKKKDGTPFVPEHKLKAFSNVKFRHAVSHAIDREGIVKTLFHGRGTPLGGFISPGNKTWANPNIKIPEYNLEKSAALLDEIGLKDTDGDGIREFANGEPMKLNIKTNPESKSRVQIANLLKTDLKKIGIQCSVQVVPFPSLVNTYKNTLDYDLLIAGWGSGTPPDPVLSKGITLSSGGAHYWNRFQKTPATPWEAEMDKLVLANQQTMDMKKRVEYWHKYQEIWAEYVPQIMIATPHLFVAIRDKIGNTHPVNMRPYFDYNIDELYDKTLAK